MTVTPSAGLSSVSVAPGLVIAGTPTTGTVTLSSAAPAGGLVVDLWTNGFPAFIPGSVTVPSGATAATFPITTVYTTSAAQSTITAFYSGTARTTTITIAPAPTIASISPPGTVASGASVSGSVFLSGPAPAGGIVVSLWTSGFPAFVPETVMIAAGTTTANFTISTVPTSAAAQPVITAFYNGAVKTVTMTVTPTINHRSTLIWNASTTTAVTYNVYRGTQAGGPYSKINSSVVDATSHVDSSVAAGQRYFYVVTAVTVGGVESGYSNEAVAVIPSD